ncbi:hypothetical protein [Nonomuraea recticatena]|uniref:hypothetical protein n=1 Tax=Nonomuraea recticatena TaxID=46178 RepID=UPI0031F9233A
MTDHLRVLAMVIISVGRWAVRREPACRRAEMRNSVSSISVTPASSHRWKYQFTVWVPVV